MCAGLWTTHPTTRRGNAGPCGQPLDNFRGRPDDQVVRVLTAPAPSGGPDDQGAAFAPDDELDDPDEPEDPDEDELAAPEPDDPELEDDEEESEDDPDDGDEVEVDDEESEEEPDERLDSALLSVR